MDCSKVVLGLVERSIFGVKIGHKLGLSSIQPKLRIPGVADEIGDELGDYEAGKRDMSGQISQESEVARSFLDICQFEAKGSSAEGGLCWSEEAEELFQRYNTSIGAQRDKLQQLSFVLNWFKSLRLCERKIARIDKTMKRFALLRSLNVSGNQLERLENLPKSLATIHAAGNYISSISLHPLNHLIFVGLSHNHLSDETLQRLVLPQCISLDVSFNNVCDLDLAIQVFRALPKLQHLCVHGNPFSLLKGHKFAVLDALPGLESLEGCPVADCKEDESLQSPIQNLARLRITLVGMKFPPSFAIREAKEEGEASTVSIVDKFHAVASLNIPGFAPLLSDAELWEESVRVCAAADDAFVPFRPIPVSETETAPVGSTVTQEWNLPPTVPLRDVLIAQGVKVELWHTVETTTTVAPEEEGAEPQVTVAETKSLIGDGFLDTAALVRQPEGMLGDIIRARLGVRGLCPIYLFSYWSERELAEKNGWEPQVEVEVTLNEEEEEEEASS